MRFKSLFFNRCVSAVGPPCLGILTVITLLASLEIGFRGAKALFPSSSHFETAKERQLRLRKTKQRRLPSDFLPEQKHSYVADLLSPDLKIGVFGGSISNGHGSPINFSEFLRDAIQDDREIILHNYGSSGMPFVDGQDQIIKYVGSYYDYLIIYSGDTDNLYPKFLSAFKDGKGISFHSGTSRTKEQVQQKVQFVNQRIARAKESHLLIQKGGLPLLLVQAMSIAANSRTFTFGAKVYDLAIAKLASVQAPQESTSVSDNHDKIRSRLPLAASQNDFSEKYVKNIQLRYLESLDAIVKQKSNGQKIVVSTLIANNLTSPYSSYLKLGANSTQLLSVIRNGYALLNSSQKNAELEAASQEYPDNAHILYLLGAQCIGSDPSFETISIPSECMKYLDSARYYDLWKGRANESINPLIRELHNPGKNVFVADPAGLLLAEQQKMPYMKFFVDDAHPSPHGHMLIANSIAPYISEIKPLSYAVLGYDSNSYMCDSFHLTSNGTFVKLVKPHMADVKRSVLTNINWLDNFKGINSRPSVYQIYYDHMNNLNGVSPICSS